LGGVGVPIGPSFADVPGGGFSSGFGDIGGIIGGIGGIY
jgi:hypothetical protein